MRDVGHRVAVGGDRKDYLLALSLVHGRVSGVHQVGGDSLGRCLRSELRNRPNMCGYGNGSHDANNENYHGQFHRGETTHCSN
jgi:hypothetical protein